MFQSEVDFARSPEGMHFARRPEVVDFARSPFCETRDRWKCPIRRTFTSCTIASPRTVKPAVRLAPLRCHCGSRRGAGVDSGAAAAARRHDVGSRFEIELLRQSNSDVRLAPWRCHCGSRREAAIGSGAAAAARPLDVGSYCKSVPYCIEIEPTTSARYGIIESACTIACQRSTFSDNQTRPYGSRRYAVIAARAATVS